LPSTVQLQIDTAADNVTAQYQTERFTLQRALRKAGRGSLRSSTSPWAIRTRAVPTSATIARGQARRALTVCGSVDDVKAAVESFAGIGADEIVLTLATDDADEVKRLAAIVF
jgi:hypothetical protein